MDLFNPLFWRSIVWALVRTALAGILPFIPTLFADPVNGWKPAVGTLVPLLIAAVATSLKGTVDPSTATWGQILVGRFLRQFGQFVAGALVGAVVLWSFDWRTLLVQAFASAFTSMVLAALTLLPAETVSGPVQVLTLDSTPVPVVDDGEL